MRWFSEKMCYRLSLPASKTNALPLPLRRKTIGSFHLTPTVASAILYQNKTVLVHVATLKV